eukprot:jgi/Tetstr1/455441/TSEL_042270.t1
MLARFEDVGVEFTPSTCAVAYADHVARCSGGDSNHAAHEWAAHGLSDICHDVESALGVGVQILTDPSVLVSLPKGSAGRPADVGLFGYGGIRGNTVVVDTTIAPILGVSSSDPTIALRAVKRHKIQKYDEGVRNAAGMLRFVPFAVSEFGSLAPHAEAFLVYADRKTSPVEFAEGDKVWLSTEHLLIRNQPARKFRQRYIGPYPVTAKISSQAYRLRLPPTFDCHNVFHVSRLRQCVNPDAQPDTIPSSVEPPVDEFVVERVLDFSIERREDLYKRGLCLVFLVRWLDYDSSHDSWEPYSALRRVEALHDFARTSRHLQDTLRSKEYANLRARHPSRFPESIPER